MSSFTNYENSAATEYDITRIPIGIEVYEGIIRKYSPQRDYKKVSLLDLGAGTGSYDKLLLESGLGSITCLDISETMINSCKSKMAKAGLTDRITYHKSMLPDIPCSDETYDIVSSNMVIHHLVQTNDQGVVDDWSPIINTFKAAHRVLKPGGVLIIGYSTPDQRGGNWYAHLVPEARSRTIARCPTGQQVLNFCNQSGFKVQAEYSLMTHYTGYETYNNPHVFNTNPGAWYMDSVLSCATREETARAKENVKKMTADNTLLDFFKKHDDIPNIGCGRLLAAVKK